MLGDKNAQTLLYSLYFCIGKIFGLRPCEHRALRLNNFLIEDNTITYRENVSKTYHGRLKDLKKKERDVTHYCYPENEHEHEQCLVEMFKQYFLFK